MKKGILTVVRVNALAFAIASVLAAEAAHAQEEQAQQSGAIEEVVAVGRLATAAESLTAERIALPVSAAFLGADGIARAGDPDIAAALPRVRGRALSRRKVV